MIYLHMLGMLIFGTASILVYKAMNEKNVKGDDFSHPYLITASMFIGEAFCLVFFHVFKKKENLKSIESQVVEDDSMTINLCRKLGKFVFCIPAFFDLIASTLIFLGLVLTAASVNQMMRGFLIVIVAFYSTIFLERKIYKYQILGASLSTIGIAIIGITSIVFKSSSASNPALGVIVLLIAQFFGGGMFITEEIIFSKISIDPLEAVGIEGVCGLAFYIILLPILYVIPCEQDFCINGRVEDTILAFEQVADSLMLTLFGISSIFLTVIFKWTGMVTTKFAGSLARSIIDTSRILFVWMGCIIIGWEEFLWPQLIGFVLLSLGTLIYYRAITIPIRFFEEEEDLAAITEETDSLKKSDLEESTDTLFDLNKLKQC